MDKQKNAGRPAHIHYLPVCSECKQIIQDEIKAVQDTLWQTDVMREIKTEFEPETCPNCGARFIGLEIHMPTIREANKTEPGTRAEGGTA